MKLWTTPFAAVLALLATISVAQAQETPAPEMTPAPAATAPAQSETPSRMDRIYDGNWHLTLAPYVWLPTVKQNVQYSIPRLPQRGVIQSSVQVGPSEYASKISSAAMFAFEARKGDLDLFGDYIYTNLSTNASVSTTISGPLGHVQIPISLTTNSRLASSIWELAAGFSVAHGHDADLNLFAGWRQFPLHLTLDYNAVIGRRGILTPSGTIKENPLANDVIFGFRGKAFFGGDHWYVPYYVDAGAGAINQTWEAFTGAGYVFDHGQTILLAYRTLNYNAFPQNSPVQRMVLYGPLLGYTFGL